MNSGYHLPVMLDECMEWLAIGPSGRYVDCTLGGGGHSSAILDRLGPDGRLDSFDRDPDAIAAATARIGDDPRWTAHRLPFGEMASVLEPESADGVLMDLGISSHQVDEPSRGFSFRRSEKADLRMDQSAGEDAARWIARVGERELKDALVRNADLRPAARAARILFAAVERDGELRMESVLEAARSVARGRADDAAARILQALRIEVNDEIGQLRSGLEAARSLLRRGGRLVVMSYHSVEDRCVKQAMAEWAKECVCPPGLPVCRCGGNRATAKVLTRRPVVPSEEEQRSNPRSRSAKLRACEKL